MFKNKVKVLIAMSVIATLGITGCGNSTTKTTSEPEAVQEQSQSISVTHELGTITLDKIPEKVAVLDFGALDVIDTLGLGDKVIGIPQDGSVPDYLSQYNTDSYKNFGTVKEVNIEALHAAQPDLIIIAGRLVDSYESLSQIAPVLYAKVDSTVGYMNSFETMLGFYSTIFGDSSAIENVLNGYQTRLSAIQQEVTSNEYTAVVSILSDRNLSVLGNNARGSLISNEAGFNNLAVGLEEATHGSSISFEYLVEQNPDFIFIIDRNTAIGTTGASPAQEVVENDLVKTTSAYTNNHIVYLNSTPWYLVEGGITSTHLMITDIETALGM